jgi:hypothetical protein
VTYGCDSFDVRKAMAFSIGASLYEVLTAPPLYGGMGMKHVVTMVRDKAVAESILVELKTQFAFPTSKMKNHLLAEACSWMLLKCRRRQTKQFCGKLFRNS